MITYNERLQRNRDALSRVHVAAITAPMGDQPPAPTTFGSLPIGARFHFSAHVESGLLADLDRVGRPTYVKVSARMWECPQYGRSQCAARAKVWAA